MAWERQSDPGLRWQLCYDLSARSWWMVGWMLPVSPSCSLPDVCVSLSLLCLFCCVLSHSSAAVRVDVSCMFPTFCSVQFSSVQCVCEGFGARGQGSQLSFLVDMIMESSDSLLAVLSASDRSTGDSIDIIFNIRQFNFQSTTGLELFPPKHPQFSTPHS